MPDEFNELLQGLMKGEEESEGAINSGIEAFGELLKKQEEIRFYVDGTPNFGHQATTVSIMKRMIDFFEYAQKITIVYQDAESGMSTPAKLALLLPGLVPANIDTATIQYSTCSDITFMKYDKERLPSETLLFGFTGGADNTGVNLAQALNVTYFLRLQPYLWDKAPNRIEYKEGEHPTVIGDNNFLRLAFKFDPQICGVVCDAVWQWYTESQTFDAQLKIRSLNARAIFNECIANKNIVLWPVYGLHQFDGIDEILFNIVLAGLHHQVTRQKPIVLVILSDIGKLNEKGCLDPFDYVEPFATDLQKSDCNIEELLKKIKEDYACGQSSQYPQDKFDKFSKYLKQFSKVIVEHSEKIKIIKTYDESNQYIDKTTDIKSSIQSAANKDFIVIFLGPVPQDVYNWFYEKAAMPGIFEGQGTSSLVVSLGRPFLQLPKTGEEQRENYPSTTLTSTNYSEVARFAKNASIDLRQRFNCYLKKQNNIDPTKYIETINDSIEFINRSSQSSFVNNYFQGLGTFYRQDIHDKLMLGLVKLNEVSHSFLTFFMKKSLPRTNTMYETGKKLTLDNVYENLVNNWKDGGVNLFDAFPGSFMTQFYKAVIPGGGFFIKVKKEDIVEEKDQQGKVIRVAVNNGATRAFGTRFGLEMEFTSQFDSVLSDLRCRSEEVWEISGIPWMGFENPGFNMKISEALVPVQGGMVGKIKGTNLNIDISYPVQDNQWVITGTFDSPYPGISSFYRMAGGINLVQSLPSPLNTLAGFGLSEAQIIYDATKNTISYMLFIMETDSPWVILSNPKLEVKPRVNAVIYNPADVNTRKCIFQIFGDFTIGEGTISIGAQYPDFQLTGSLTGGVIQLSDLARLFGAEVDLQAAVTEFYMFMRPENQEYVIDTSITSDWPVTISGTTLFTITGLGFNVNGSMGKYMVSLSGSTIILPDSANIGLTVSALYAGDQAGWTFEGKQTSGVLPLGDIITYYLDWEPGEQGKYGIDGLGLTIATGGTTTYSSYTFTGKTAEPWEIPFIDGLTIYAAIKLGYIGGSITEPVSAENGQSTTPALAAHSREMSPAAMPAAGAGDLKPGPFGEIEAAVKWHFIDIKVYYNFKPEYRCFCLNWNGISAKVEQKKVGEQLQWIGSLSLSGWTLGRMVETFISWATGQTFGLAAPWNLLNHISLDSFQLQFNFTTNQVSFSYDIGPIDLGLAKIDKIWVKYEPTGADKGVNVTLEGRFLWKTKNPTKPLDWNAAKPEQTPAPPGQGSKYFDLRLLALGQHVAVYGSDTFTSVQDAIDKMRNMAVPSGTQIPISANPQAGQPYFNPDNSWLIGADFGILRVDPPTTPPAGSKAAAASPTYLLSMSIIFNDPTLYALRIALDSDKAKILKGLDFQIMYKKISDTVGVYQSEIKLPDAMRNLTIGAYSITLPIFGIEIYTNGDFKVDIGFPWNMDFSRSFTIQGIVMAGPIPIPVLGSGGFYFGKLSSATTNLVPKTGKGDFNPVLVFGVGMQVGVGKYVEYGILKAGFSITVAGILEGVIAKWNPSLPDNTGGSPPDQLQGEYFFRMQGTVGVIGKLYGSVDFAIIKAMVNIEVMLMVQITYESYASIPISVIASVDISLALSINLGLFKITIRLSFSARIKETFTIENRGTPPWEDRKSVQSRNFRALQRKRLRPVRMQYLLAEDLFDTGFTMTWSNLTPAETPGELTSYLLPYLTVSGDGAQEIGEQKPCYVPLMFIETIDTERHPYGDGSTPFEALCKQILRWTIAAAQPRGSYTCGQIDRMVISGDILHATQDYLGGQSDVSKDLTVILSAADAEAFMKGQFTMKVTAPTGQGEKHAAVFAMPRLMGLDVPAYDDVGPFSYTFDEFSKANDRYLKELRQYFNQLAVVVQEEMERQPRMKLSMEEDTGESIAGFIFGDYFLLIARQMIKSALDAMRTFKWPINPDLSIEQIVNWINKTGDLSGDDLFTAEDLFEGNTKHKFNPDKTLYMSGPTYTSYPKDSLDSIAEEYGQSFTAVELASRNAGAGGIISPGVTITYDDGSGTGDKTYTVREPDTFASIAWTIAGGSIETLFLISDIAGLKDLLKQDSLLALSPLTYQVSGDDTVDTIVSAFPNGFTGPELAQRNILSGELFVAGAKIAYSQSQTYTVAKTDTFMSIAAAIAGGDIDKLFSVSDIATLKGLLRPLTVLTLPTFAYKTAADDSPAVTAARFDIPVHYLANDRRNLTGITGLFQVGEEENAYLDITHLKQFEVSEIIDEIQRSGGLSHLSGMVSRYHLHGLRLPTELPDGGKITFMEAVDMPGEAGIYRISGQQFEIPGFSEETKDDNDDPYVIHITKPTDLDWIVFDNDPDNTELTITPADTDKKAIAAVSTFATKQGLKPDTRYLGIQPMFNSAPAQYNFSSTTTWQNAAAVHLPYGVPPAGARLPLKIWQLPESLINLPQRGKDDVLPRFSIQIGTYNEATSKMDETPASYYGWGTKVEVGIKRVSPVPTSPATVNTYELMGANDYDVVLLERLLAELQTDEGKIDSLTLLYYPRPTGESRKGLQSDDPGAVTFFISQVNLTTDTQPPGTGIKAAAKTTRDEHRQSKLDFIRLLWENSITRSGGYYLYYHNAQSGSGFPAGIFNDNGEAKIALLVTYSNVFRDRVTGFMNCAVTGDAIDISRSVVFARSNPGAPISYTPGAQDTLAGIAAKYYMNPIRLAEDNAGHELNANVNVAVHNGSYEVGISGPTSPQEIADHFGISLDDLKNANPGIMNWPAEFPLFQALKLPAVTVTIGSSPGGTTLTGLAGYYGAAAAEIAYKNQAVPGLFSTAAPLTITGGPDTRTAAVPAGAVALEAERTVPPEVPGNPEDPNYGEYYLEHVFNMLGYRVMENVDFISSNPGLPMSPVIKPGEPGEETGEKMRKAKPVKQAGELWEYQQAVPFWKFAGDNNSLKNSLDSRLPNPIESPYQGIGNLLQVKFQWLDIFGNQTITPLDNPAMQPDAPLNAPPVLTGYIDKLLSLGQWPGVSCDYIVYMKNGVPTFTIDIEFDPSSFEPPKNSNPGTIGEDPVPAWKKAAQIALVTYTTLFYQVTRENPANHKEKAVTFSFRSSLFGGSPIKLEKCDVTEQGEPATLIEWISSICILIKERADAPGDAKPGSFNENPPGPLNIAYTITGSEINTKEIFELTATFNMERDIAYVDADFKDTPEIYKAPTAVSALTTLMQDKEDEPGTYTLDEFVTNFEETLCRPGQYELKLATGSNREHFMEKGIKTPLWAVRVGLAEDQAISYKILNPGAPKIFAPRPLANTLQNYSGVPIYDYKTGSGIDFETPWRHQDFSGIDMDVWMRLILAAVDNILSPAFTSPLGILFNHKGIDYLENLKTSKKLLAKFLANLVIPVLAGQEVNANEINDAREAFKQQLSIRLSDFYNTDAVIQFRSSVTADIREKDSQELPRLFGAPVEVNKDPQQLKVQEYTLTSAKLDLGTTSFDNPALLTFLLSSSNKKSGEEELMKPYVSLDLEYRGTNIEHDIGKIPGIEGGYKASSWLTFLGDDSENQPLKAALGSFDVPLVLRAYPTLPSMKNQAGEASKKGQTDQTLEQSTLWDYSFTYGEDYHYAQDRTCFTVNFNIADKDLANVAAGGDPFYNMAEFITIYPKVEKDLIEYLGKIDSSTTENEIFDNAAVAVESFNTLVGNIAASLKNGDRQAAARASMPGGIEYKFFIEETSVTIEDDGKQNTPVEALLVTLSGKPPTGIGNPGVSIDGYTAEPYNSGGEGNEEIESCEWIYRDNDTQKLLSAAVGRRIADRKITLPRMNILANQDAWSAALLTRNLVLVPGVVTAEPFVYRTPEIRFVNPLHPTLDVTDTIDIAMINSTEPVTRSLARHLSTLFRDLFRSDPQETQAIQLECRYVYSLQDKLSPIDLPVLLLPPTIFNVKTDPVVPGGGCPPGSAEQPSLVCTVSNAIFDWFNAQKPIPTDGTLRFDLTVMSDLTKQPMPLLRLRKLKLGIRYINPALPTFNNNKTLNGEKK